VKGSKKRDPRPTVVAVVSDKHAGSTTALCPPTIRLDDGGEYHASKMQRWLWQSWGAYWARVAEVRSQLDASLIEVFNGDMVDGDHHNTSQIISRNPNATALVLSETMKAPLGLDPDHIVVVRGTEAHVGHSASAEERIADGLVRDGRPVARDPETGATSWWHWKAEVHGVRLDVTHHGRTGQREHTRGGAAVLYAHDILLAHVKRGEAPPHLCFRGHHHRWNDSGDACPTRVITTGAWQFGPSGYVKKVAPDTLPDIAAAIAVIWPDGRHTVEKVEFQPERAPLWKP
jgi:hypothetical protein